MRKSLSILALSTLSLSVAAQNDTVEKNKGETKQKVEEVVAPAISFDNKNYYEAEDNSDPEIQEVDSLFAAWQSMKVSVGRVRHELTKNGADQEKIKESNSILDLLELGEKFYFKNGKTYADKNSALKNLERAKQRLRVIDPQVVK